MDPRTLEASFRDFARHAGVALSASVPSIGIETMLRFFRECRVDGCSPASDADMLLVQWGTYDWGSGENFEFDLTRQVILPDEEEDEAIWQLHLTYRFPPSAELRGLGSGNRWCSSPDEAPTFLAWIKGTPAYAAVAALVARSVEVEYECAG